MNIKLKIFGCNFFTLCQKKLLYVAWRETKENPIYYNEIPCLVITMTDLKFLINMSTSSLIKSLRKLFSMGLLSLHHDKTGRFKRHKIISIDYEKVLELIDKYDSGKKTRFCKRNYESNIEELKNLINKQNELIEKIYQKTELN